MARQRCKKCLCVEFNYLRNKTEIVIECRQCLKPALIIPVKFITEGEKR